MVTVLLVAYRRFSKRVKAPIFPPHKFWFEEIATALVVLKESHVQLHRKICGETDLEVIYHPWTIDIHRKLNCIKYKYSLLLLLFKSKLHYQLGCAHDLNIYIFQSSNSTYSKLLL